MTGDEFWELYVAHLLNPLHYYHMIVIAIITTILLLMKVNLKNTVKVAFLIIVVKEIFDFVDHLSFDLWDVYYGLVGIFTGWVIYYAIKGDKEPSSEEVIEHEGKV